MKTDKLVYLNYTKMFISLFLFITFCLQFLFLISNHYIIEDNTTLKFFLTIFLNISFFMTLRTFHLHYKKDITMVSFNIVIERILIHISLFLQFILWAFFSFGFLL